MNPHHNPTIISAPIREATQVLPTDLGSAILIQGAPLGSSGLQTGVPLTNTRIVNGINPGSHLPTATHGVVGSTTPVGSTQGLIHSNEPSTFSALSNTTAATAQGEFIFRPLEGRFTNDKDPVGKMDPYVKVKIGWHSGKSSVARNQGTNATWNDSITLQRKHNETFAKLKIKDKDRVTLNDRIGEVKINLDEIVQLGGVSKWYPVLKKNQPAGEILLDIQYAPTLVR